MLRGFTWRIAVAVGLALLAAGAAGAAGTVGTSFPPGFAVFDDASLGRPVIGFGGAGPPWKKTIAKAIFFFMSMSEYLLSISFTAAAKELGVTTAAVSAQVKSLEADIGVPLFRRHTRAVADPGRRRAAARRTPRP